MAKLNLKNKSKDELEKVLLDNLAAFIEKKPYCYVSDIPTALPEWKGQAFCEPSYSDTEIAESCVSPALLFALEKLKQQGRIRFYCGCGEVKDSRKKPKDNMIRRYKGRRLFDISFVSKEFYDAQIANRYHGKELHDYDL